MEAPTPHTHTQHTHTHTHTFFTSPHPRLHFSQTPKKGYNHRIQPSKGTGLKILNIRALTKVYKLPVKLVSRRSLSSKGLYEILRDIGISTNQISRIKEKINRTTTLHKWICNLTPSVSDILKYCGKEEKLLLRRKFSSFLQYFVTRC